MNRIILSLTILIILTTACTPQQTPTPTQTVAQTATMVPTPTPTPTPLPLPVGSASSEQVIEATEILKEVPADSVVLLKPIEEIKALQGISINLDALQNDFPDLTAWEVLAAVDTVTTQELHYSLVIKTQQMEQTVLVLAQSINIDGTEIPTKITAFFEEFVTGELQVKTIGITYTLSEVNDQEELGIYWQEEQPLLVRARLEHIYAQVWHTGAWQISELAEGLEWDGMQWKRIIPALPDWAHDYINFHQGQPDTINGIDYYISQKTVQVGEESRQIIVKMVEYDQKAQEWIPCYDTVQELLDTRQLGSLHELNNISTSEEAVWIVRETWPESEEDLQKLEAMFHEFGVQIEAEVDHYSFWPRTFFIKLSEGFLFRSSCSDENCAFNQISVDNFSFNEPKSWITLRREDNQQIIIGTMIYELPGIIWLGLDQAGFNFFDERIHPQIRNSFNEALFSTINHNNLFSQTGFGFETSDFLSATPESTTAWADVLDYYAQLPADEQLFHYDAAASWSPFGRENPAWIEYMSGKINWLSSGMYAIEKE